MMEPRTDRRFTKAYQVRAARAHGRHRPFSCQAHLRKLKTASRKTTLVGRLAVLVLLSLAATTPCFGMITGGKGNKPINDPGWPSGAAKVFNWPTRVAWWEGPPFGGGQWHAECKGNAAVLNEVLEAFQKIDTPKKRLIVRDGIGYSFWLDPNGQKRADRTTKIDWVFTVWQPDRWQFQKGLPPNLTALRGDSSEAPVPEIHIYAATIHWSEVRVPPGIEIVDQRLEAHGFDVRDGRVIEGIITDAATGLPLKANVRVERVLAKSTGGYDYQPAETTTTNDQGRWFFKDFPDQWSRLIAECDGYAPRVLRYVRYDRQPGWERADASLSKAVDLSGRVVDQDGNPLAGVQVSVSDLTVGSSGPYKQPGEASGQTGSDGKFLIRGLPEGSGKLRGRLDGYFGPGLELDIGIAPKDCELQMKQASSLLVHVEFAKPRVDKRYIVQVIPEGGEKVGSWGGSSHIDEHDSVRFANVPPGRYIVRSRPNPGSKREQTKDILVELEGGKETILEIKAVSE